MLPKVLACLECTVAEQVDYGARTVFVGRIEAAHVSDRDVPRVYNLSRGESRR